MNLHFIIKLIFFTAVYGIAICLISCNEAPKKIVNNDTQEQEYAIKEKLIEKNKEILKAEEETIEGYIIRHELNMIKTPSGLRYHKMIESKGDSIKSGDKVKVSYSVYLLDGTHCYSSDSTGLLTFKVGEYDVPNGFHEIALLLKVGEKAQLIIPSHLAYGITGDNNKIPYASALNCFIEIKERN